jgi:predicted site-specific integrase-resolvase
VTVVTESDAEEELTTAVAAKRVGVSRMTLIRYVEQGYVTPARVLPSGHRRWKLSELQRQLRDLPPRGERGEPKGR